MGYSRDLRESILAFIDAGRSKAMAYSLFKVSRQTIYDWMNLRKKMLGSKSFSESRSS